MWRINRWACSSQSANAGRDADEIHGIHLSISSRRLSRPDGPPRPAGLWFGTPDRGAIGGTAIGKPLLELCGRAYPALKRRCLISG